MKILHAAETIQGGIATILRLLISYQIQDKTNIVSCLIPKAQYAELNVNGFEKVRTFSRRKRNSAMCFSFCYNFLKSVWTEKPDVVHLHSSYAGALGRIILILLRPLRNPHVIYCPHGFSFIMHVSKFKKVIFSKIEYLLQPTTDVIICTSEFEKKEAIRWGLSPTNVVIIYNGISGPMNHFPCFENPYNPKLFNILFVGRLDRQKGFDILFRAVQLLEKNKYHLTVVGDNVLERSLSLNEENITYKGWLKSQDIEPFYSNCDVVVVPSRWESFGLVAVEAMSYGKAVIASGSGSLPEIIEDGVSGMLFECGNEMELAYILQNADTRKWNQMGRLGRQRFLKLFTSEKMVFATKDLYKGAFKKRFIGEHGQEDAVEKLIEESMASICYVNNRQRREPPLAALYGKKELLEASIKET